jgi:tetratricopeptide (TPR) repeat protein
MIRAFAALGVCAGLLMAWAPTTPAQEPAALTPAEIRAALGQGDYGMLEMRLNALQQRFETDPAGEETLVSTFRVFRSLRAEPEATEQALSGWVDAYPRSYAARAARGAFYLGLGLDARGTGWAADTSARQFRDMERFFDRARADLTASLELTAQPLVSHMSLISLAMRSRADDGEDRYYRAALAYAPRSIELRALRMITLQPRWGGSYEAMEAHARASETVLGPGPGADRLYRMIAEDRGRVLIQDKKYPAAHALYAEAIERYDGPGVRCGRARAAVMLGRWPEAMQDMAEAMRDWKPHEYCAETAAWMAATRSDHPGMFELLDGYLQRNPEHTELLTRHGWALQQRGELAAAYADYALAAEQGNVWAQTMAGRYVFNGWGGVPVDHEKGLELFRRSAAAGDADAQLSLVQALSFLGRHDEASELKQRFAARKRTHAHAATAAAEEAPARAPGWWGYVLDRRVQAVALGLVLVLLILARARRQT